MSEPRDHAVNGRALTEPETLVVGPRNDEAGLSAIYEDVRSELFGFLLGMTHDRGTAEELLQDVFVRLIRETRAGRSPTHVRAWLYRVATNAAISRSRRGQVALRAMPRLLDRSEPVQPEGEILRRERDVTLRETLALLTPDARAALLLAAAGFDGRETAIAIGRTDGATRVLLCRARVRLRLMLEAAELER